MSSIESMFKSLSLKKEGVQCPEMLTNVENGRLSHPAEYFDFLATNEKEIPSQVLKDYLKYLIHIMKEKVGEGDHILGPSEITDSEELAIFPELAAISLICRFFSRRSIPMQFWIQISREIVYPGDSNDRLHVLLRSKWMSILESELCFLGFYGLRIVMGSTRERNAVDLKETMKIWKSHIADLYPGDHASFSQDRAMEQIHDLANQTSKYF